MVGALAVWNVWTVVWAQPNYLSYGNELVGGSRGAQRVLLGSNFDLGQDLFRLKQWARTHPRDAPLVVTYYGVPAVESVGLQSAGLPASFLSDRSDRDVDREVPGGDFCWAISSNILNGLTTRPMLIDGRTVVAVVQSPLLKPENAVASVGGTIFIFRVNASGNPARRSGLRADDLRSCFREARPGDFSNAP